MFLDGLRAVDISNVSNPTELGIVYEPPIGYFHKIWVENNLAFVSVFDNETGDGHLIILDVSNPVQPIELGIFSPGPDHQVRKAYIQGNYLYVISGGLSDFGYLRVVDISNPQAPQEIGVFQKPGEAFVDVAITENIGYITTAEGGFYIIDLSNPANPFEVSYYELSGASRVVIEDNYAYIWNDPYVHQTRGHLYILNISIPKNPIEVASHNDFAGEIWDVTVSGDYIFLANYMGGVYALYFPSTLSINYPNGIQGSYFTLQGKKFNPNTSVTVLVNGREIGAVQSDSMGGFEFVLSTENADDGNYVVSTIANVKASASFRLGADYPLRTLESTGTVFDVPTGIAYTKFLFFPEINN